MKSSVLILSMIALGSSASIAEEMNMGSSDASMKMQDNAMNSNAIMSDGTQKDIINPQSMDSGMMKSDSMPSGKDIVNIAPEPQTLEKNVSAQD